MASLTGSSVATSYDQLLALPSGGGNTTTLVAITDGNAGTTFCLQLATTKAMIEGNASTLYFFDEGGEKISADNAGILSIAGGAEIDITTPTVDINASTAVTVDTPAVTVTDATASSATEGGFLRLASDDGAVMASGHRLGVLEFGGAEDTSNTITVGARIEALTDAIWSASENGAYMSFYTTDGNAAQTERLRLDSTSIISLSNNTASGSSNNTVFGSAAGENIASGGNNNTLFGDNAGNDITTGDDNVVIGYQAGDKTLLSGKNVVIGSGAAGGVMTAAADGTIAIGYTAGAAITSGADNLAIGENSMLVHTTGSRNMAIGNFAMDDNDHHADTLASIDNVFIGYDSGGGTWATNDCNYNVAVGNYTLDDAMNGAVNNVAVGHLAGSGITTATNDVLIGYGAGDALTTGSHSVAIGYLALSAETTSSFNVGIGYQALGIQDGGVGNVAIGRDAGSAVTGGDAYTFVGYNAGNGATDGSNSVCIGNETDVTPAGVSYAIAIGDSVVAGANDFAFGKASNVVKCDFDDDADWARNSDERKKRNIENATLGLEFINDLRTVTYQWKPAEEHPEAWEAWHYEKDEDGNNVGDKIYDEMNTDAVMHGMIAQEVKAALDTAGVDTFKGWSLKDPENADGQQLLSSGMFVFPLIKAVQELSAKVTALENA